MEVELVLINGERRRFVVKSHSGSIASALDRLDEWVQTADGGWVQKTHVVEVRPVMNRARVVAEQGTAEELDQLTEAAGALAQAAEDEDPAAPKG